MDQVVAAEADRGIGVVAGEHFVGRPLIAAVLDVEHGMPAVAVANLERVAVDRRAPVLPGDEVHLVRVPVAETEIVHRDQAPIRVKFPDAPDPLNSVFLRAPRIVERLLGHIPNHVRKSLVTLDDVIKVRVVRL